MNPVVRKVGVFRVIVVVTLCLTVFYQYWVAPKLDRLTPWEGTIPGSCGVPAQATPAGLDALLYDVGALPRKIAAGPPTKEQMIGWFSGAGTSTARAVSLIDDGAEGRPEQLQLAPVQPAPAPLQVSAPGVLTDAQVAQLATQAGWPAAEVPTVVARVIAESSGNPRARDYADGSHWGLLQLGEAERARYIPGQDAFDPLVNLKGGLLLWQERGWQPWRASDSMVQNAAATPCAPGGAPNLTYVNGQMPDTALVNISVGGRLQGPAAASFERLNMAYQAAFGRPIVATDTYRSRAGQEDCTRRKGSMCAVPGTSRHGLGIAVDFGGGVERYDSPQHEWMVVNGPQFGWFLPSWAQRGGSKPEPWHWEYGGEVVRQAG